MGYQEHGLQGFQLYVSLQAHHLPKARAEGPVFGSVM